MSSRCLVDTSGWYAFFVDTEVGHRTIKDRLLSGKYRLITTDFILDEAMTLFRMNKQVSKAQACWDLLTNDPRVQMIYLSKDDIFAAWEIFRSRNTGWSFTDCASKHVIDSRKIRTACSLDKHFREFENVAVFPEPAP